MNLYLLLALAFGALTGVADVAVPNAAAVTVGVRAERRALVAGRRSQIAASEKQSDPRPATCDPRTPIAPMRGAISPRAPAANC